MFIYCLISSLMNVSIFLMEHHLDVFEQSRRLCEYYSINALSINIGILSWPRQFIPIICLILYSYSISIFIFFIPQCDYIPCSSCHTKNLKYMFVWLTFSFIIPELIMFSSTIILIIHLSQPRTDFNRSTERNLFYRIVIQMT